MMGFTNTGLEKRGVLDFNMGRNITMAQAQEWYAAALGELYGKLARIKDEKLAHGITKGRAYFLSLNERRTLKEINKLKESRANLAEYFGATDD